MRRGLAEPGGGPAAGLVCYTKGFGFHRGQWENLKDFFIFIYFSTIRFAS